MTTHAPEPLRLPAAAVGPVAFRVAPFDDCVDAIMVAGQRVRERSAGLPVHFANAYTIALADSDPPYAALLTDPRAAVFSDGVPVTWFGRRFFPDHAADWERVYGPDVMTAVFERDSGSLTHYLLGGSTEALVQLQSTIARRWPTARVVGAESPPFRPLTATEITEQDERIRASGADLVWVGLGTPKQDWEAARIAAQVPVVALAVGAAFDFLSGIKTQAPRWMQRSGTEWLYRFGTEPRRLAQRYLWGNPRFVRAAWRDRPRRH